MKSFCYTVNKNAGTIPDINVPEIAPVITSFIMIFVKFIRNTAALIPNERNTARSDFIFLPIIKIILK